MRDALGSVQSVLVLGGGSDIAQATVRALVADRTRTVVLAARHPEELAAFASTLAPASADCIPFEGRDTASHPKVVDEVWARHGDIDLALIAFGVLGDHDRSAHETNMVGAASAALAVVERMRAQGHGTVAVLSSVAGERVRKAAFVYGASKAGLDGFCQGLADSLVGSGVHVMIVRPGFVHTKMTAGREAAPLSTTPEAVAAAIVTGIRGQADIVWVPPVLRWVGVVFRHLPRALWRRIER
jgi:decaprenylphospho-beta-D-erythro-pentofuranosid-2-ulose 2-reductase